MIWRKIFGEEWHTLNDAFYSKPDKGFIKGSYWSWLLQGKENQPKIWIFCYHIAAQHYLNGVKSIATHTKGKSFGTMLACWYFDKGKMKDLFAEQSMTTVEKNKMISKTKKGYELELSGSFPRFNLFLRKDNKTILKCKSKKVDFSKSKPVQYKESWNTKSFLDEKNNAYWLMSESIRVPQIVKYTNLFNYCDVNFMGKKFSAMSYSEKNHTMGPPVPWKYAIFDLKDGSRFRFFWSFKSPLRTPSDLDLTLDCAKTKKKYFFHNFKDLEFHYLDKNKKKGDKFTPSTKYIVLKNKDKNGVKMELLAEVMSYHSYKYTYGIIGMDYIQILHKLKKLEIIDNGKKIKMNPKDSFGYGEFVDFIRG